jgi:glycine/D-amino acid oxidase-like deaminating enzyme
MNHGHSPPKTADSANLGAGVMGASIAFHLAQRKPGGIIVLDKDYAGHGASVCPAPVLPTFGQNMSPSVVLVARDRRAGGGCCHGYHDTPPVSAGRVRSAD